ncbi:UDP-N-acetylmuramoyl-tripeptide--D-alanyl-D-alanine ligase [Acidobacteriota bacterium]
MVELSGAQLAQKMRGHIVQGSPSRTFNSYSIDSRTSSQGSLFFALTAERNGHLFIPDALKKGAAGAVISQDILPVNKANVLLHVEDTTRALQILAHKVLEESDCQVVGITGSIGKTTTKEFTSQLLAENYTVLKSKGNFNNHLGLPLSLLNLTPEHEIAVLEMGMNHQGEIQELTQIAPPNVAVITNIKPVHLEYFESIEGIAAAKKEILQGAHPEGTAVLNADDFRVLKIAKDWKGKKILFGQSDQCDIRAQKIKKIGLEGMTFQLVYGSDSAEVRLPFLYESYLENFLAAAAVAYAYSVPIKNILHRLPNLEPSLQRGVHLRLEGDVHLIDDSYNSNPAALETVLKSLSVSPCKRKIAVLGDMLELGKQKDSYHFQAGRAVAQNNWDVLITVGPLSRHTAEGALFEGLKKENIFSFDNSAEAALNVKKLIKKGDLILIKGSRGARMENIVKFLLAKGK